MFSIVRNFKSNKRISWIVHRIQVNIPSGIAANERAHKKHRSNVKCGELIAIRDKKQLDGHRSYMMPPNIYVLLWTLSVRTHPMCESSACDHSLVRNNTYYLITSSFVIQIELLRALDSWCVKHYIIGCSLQTFTNANFISTGIH